MTHRCATNIIPNIIDIIDVHTNISLRLYSTALCAHLFVYRMWGLINKLHSTNFAARVAETLLLSRNKKVAPQDFHSPPDSCATSWGHPGTVFQIPGCLCLSAS